MSERSGPGTVSGLVLAAGTSSRLGRPKQLLLLGGRPVLQHVVDAAVAAGLDEVVVVLGHRAREIAVAVPPRGPVRVALNPDFAAGQSTSLRAGLRAADAEAAAVVVLLGDQPTVRPAAIRAVVEAFRGGAGPVVQASYGGIPAHPTLLARSIWEEVAASVRGDEGARSVIAAMPGSRDGVEIAGRPPDDLDTVEDYARLQRDWETRPRS